MSKTQIKIYASFTYLMFTSIPTIFYFTGTGYALPIGIAHGIILTGVIFWFVTGEL